VQQAGAESCAALKDIRERLAAATWNADNFAKKLHDLEGRLAIAKAENAREILTGFHEKARASYEKLRSAIIAAAAQAEAARSGRS
jgi:hypothetical protein